MRPKSFCQSLAGTCPSDYLGLLKIGLLRKRTLSPVTIVALWNEPEGLQLESDTQSPSLPPPQSLKTGLEPAICLPPLSWCLEAPAAACPPMQGPGKIHGDSISDPLTLQEAIRGSPAPIPAWSWQSGNQPSLAGQQSSERLAMVVGTPAIPALKRQRQENQGQPEIHELQHQGTEEIAQLAKCSCASSRT